MADPIGAKLTVDISELKARIAQANNLIKENEREWRVNASTMDDWTKSEKGLSDRMETLSKDIKTYQDNIEELTKDKKIAIAQYGEESEEVKALNKMLDSQLRAIERSKKEYKQVSTSLDKMKSSTNNAGKETKELGSEIDLTTKETKDMTKESKKADKALDSLEKEAKDAGEGFTIAKGAIAGFVANGLTAIVSGVSNAVSSLFGLTEATAEYRREMGRITTVAEQVGVSGDRIIDKWIDVNSVINDDASVTEGLNNLMTAGFATEKELDGITKALEGAAIQWSDTLKFEGLSDSLQEWIGSDGANLTGQFAELLERLGYNLEDVTEQTKNMTDEQRRNWAIQTLNKEGMAGVSDAYREANADLIAYNKANADLVHAQSQLGEAMQPFVTTVKQSTADILYSFVDMANGVEGAGDQLLYNVGYLAGQIYKNVKDFLSMLIPVIADAIPDIISTIQTHLPEFIAQGIAMITNLIDGASQMMPQLMSDTTTMLLDIVNMIAEYAPDLLSSALTFFGSIVDAIPTIITQIATEMPKIIDTVTGKLFEGEESLFNSAINFLGKIIDAIPNIIENLSVEFPKIIDKISQSLTDAMPTILQGAKDLLHKIVEAIPDVIASLAESLPDIINKILQFLVDNAPAILEGAKDMFIEIVNAIPTVVASLGEALWDILTTITQFFIDNAGEIFDIGKDIVNGLIEGIKSMGNAILDVGQWIYDHTIGAVLDFFGINSPSTEMRDKVGKMIPAGIIEGIKAVPNVLSEGAKWLADNTIGKITSYFEGKSIGDIGKDIVNGVMSGIKSMGSAISEGAKWLSDNTIGRVKGWLGIASPSKVMRDEVGKYVSQGMAIGIKDGEYYVADSMAELAEAGITALDENLEPVENVAPTAVNSFTEGWNDAINGAKNDIAKSAEDAVGYVGEAITNTAGNAGKEAGKSITSSMAKSIKDYSGEVESTLTSLFEMDYSSLIDSILGGFAKTSTVGSILSGVLAFVKKTLTSDESELTGTLEELAQALANGLINAFNNIVDNLPAIVDGAIQFMRSFALALVKAIPEIIKRLPEIIQTIVIALVEDGIPALFEVGVELITGLIEGMFSINLWDVVKGIGNGIVNGFKKLFGIKSPSKVMADEVGKNLALGIEEGLTDNIRGVNDALRNGVDTSLEMDGIQRKQVNVYQTNNYSQAHSRYELYKSKRDMANAVKLALQGV